MILKIRIVSVHICVIRLTESLKTLMRKFGRTAAIQYRLLSRTLFVIDDISALILCKMTPFCAKVFSVWEISRLLFPILIWDEKLWQCNVTVACLQLHYYYNLRYIYNIKTTHTGRDNTDLYLHRLTDDLCTKWQVHPCAIIIDLVLYGEVIAVVSHHTLCWLLTVAIFADG